MLILELRILTPLLDWKRCSSSRHHSIPFPSDTVGFAPKFQRVVGVLINEILCPMFNSATILG